MLVQQTPIYTFSLPTTESVYPVVLDGKLYKGYTPLLMISFYENRMSVYVRVALSGNVYVTSYVYDVYAQNLEQRDQCYYTLVNKKEISVFELDFLLTLVKKYFLPDVAKYFKKNFKITKTLYTPAPSRVAEFTEIQSTDVPEIEEPQP